MRTSISFTSAPVTAQAKQPFTAATAVKAIAAAEGIRLDPAVGRVHHKVALFTCRDVTLPAGVVTAPFSPQNRMTWPPGVDDFIGVLDSAGSKTCPAALWERVWSP